MSDDEREAQKREALDIKDLRQLLAPNSERLDRLLSSLKRARAERDAALRDLAACETAGIEIIRQRDEARDERDHYADLVKKQDEEIARLTGPPGASAMELGARAYGFVTMPDPVSLAPRQIEIIEGCARAIEAAEALGRAQMREEAAQAALRYRDEADAGRHSDIGDPEHSLGQGFAANLIAKRIRTLPNTLPTTEEPT